MWHEIKLTVKGKPPLKYRFTLYKGEIEKLEYWPPIIFTDWQSCKDEKAFKKLSTMLALGKITLHSTL